MINKKIFLGVCNFPLFGGYVMEELKLHNPKNNYGIKCMPKIELYFHDHYWFDAPCIPLYDLVSPWIKDEGGEIRQKMNDDEFSWYISLHYGTFNDPKVPKGILMWSFLGPRRTKSEFTMIL